MLIGEVVCLVWMLGSVVVFLLEQTALPGRSGKPPVHENVLVAVCWPLVMLLLAFVFVMLGAESWQTRKSRVAA